jgi:hypoxanthine phosphoribosyltransferase
MDKLEVLYSAEQIADRVRALSFRIARDYSDDILAVCILKGAFIFTADLVRQLSERGKSVQIEFIRASSYKGDASTGRVSIHSLIPSVTGRDVLLVEDIVDTGLTLNKVVEHMMAEGASKVRTCCLLDKYKSRVVDFKPDYVGFEIDNHFVVGYGLDHDENLRALPYLGILPRA